MAKAKKKAKSKSKKVVAKAKPAAKGNGKAKAKSKAKSKAKGTSKSKAKATPKKSAVVAKGNPTPKAEREPAPPTADEAATGREPSGATGMAPFALAETSPGKFSLLLARFDPADGVFEAAGLEGGGYSWEGIAKHVVETVIPEVEGRFGLDPEASMFVAYGEDRAALERLGVELARVFHDQAALAAMIQQIGPGNFED